MNSGTILKEDMKMFQVRCENEVANFATMNEAKAFAEKESWIRNASASITTPEGKIIKVKV